MDDSDKVDLSREQKDKLITFPIPTSLLDFHENNITLDNIYTKSSKEEILSRALKFHSNGNLKDCLLYTSPSPRDRTRSRMPSSA